MAATAPYNFVRLPRKVLRVDAGVPLADGTPARLWERQDEFVPGTTTGWLDVELTTLSPLFTRAREGFPEPCTDDTGRPIVPGSSVRGALRALIEILAFAKPHPVHDGKLVFRNLDPWSPEGKEFLRRIGDPTVEAGFIRRRLDGSHVIEPAAERGRIDWDALRDAFGTDELRRCGTAPGDSAMNAANLATRARYHAREVWVEAREGEARATPWYSSSIAPRPGWREARLVVTGPMGRRKRGEHIFVIGSGARIPIPERIWDLFHADEQLSQYQKAQFTSDRLRHGHIVDGDPVFFQCDAERSAVTFFGRSEMFRQPYDKSPAELVPARLEGDALDLAEAIFGRVGAKSAPSIIKGRVRVRDARLHEAVDPGSAVDEQTYSALLSSPKPTMAPFYLADDDDPSRRREGRPPSYLPDRPPRTEIRGHKLYWHRWDDKVGLANAPSGAATQMSEMRPVLTGQYFSLRIDFDGLAPLELGALVAALELPDGCAHHLGGGQPLGLGSVKMAVKDIWIVDRARRYGAAGAERDFAWSAGALRTASGSEREAWRRAFAEAILAHARDSGEPAAEGANDLWDLGRLQELRVMLGWDGRPEPAQTAQMPLERFERTLLPPPHAAKGRLLAALATPPVRPLRAEPKPAVRRPATTHPQKGEHVVACNRGRVSKKGLPFVTIVEDGSDSAYDACTLIDPSLLPALGEHGEFEIVTGGANPQLGPRRTPAS
jgi:CRISPR-associated protein (TIGR03986 family)